MLYLIRHGQSDFNYEADIKLKEQKGQQFSSTMKEYVDLKFDPRFIDCGLNETGRKQCVKAQIEMGKIDIDIVIVSPMRRALQTCDIVFSKHQNKPPIIVDPDVREIFSSSCDIGGRIRQGMQEFPHFDFSNIKDPDFWYFHSVKNTAIREKLFSNLTKSDENIDINSRASSIMLDYLIERYKKEENHVLSDFPAQKKKIKGLGEKYKNIAIVSHSQNIKAYTGILVQNGQVVRFEIDKL